MSDDLYKGLPFKEVDSYSFERATSLPTVTWSKIDMPPRKPHPDPVVEALMRTPFDDCRDPLNAYDDAEEIVAIVREAIRKHEGK